MNFLNIGVYDVVVVGAGPAGSSAAKKLSEAGLHVLLIEQRRYPGEKVQCAECVPRIIDRYADVPKEHIAQYVSGMKTIICGEEAGTISAPGWILNRERWDFHLAKLAENAGSKARYHAKVIGFNDNEITASGQNGLFRVKTKYIIGCDGPFSVVSRWLDNELHMDSFALQYELPLAQSLSETLVYFEPEYFGGYGWVFPKGMTANVGIGVHYSHRTKVTGLLRTFAAGLKKKGIVVSAEPIRITSGWIPGRGLNRNLTDGKLLLAGDAAGCTHPITGAGILNAVVSGRIAAQVIIEHFDDESEMIIGALTKKYTEQFSNLPLAVQRLTERNANWTKQEDTFAELIRRTWNAFPEYYVMDRG